ncbi:MAG: glycosyltransferase family 2 protein [Bacteroidetes bacterium]|jgi:glycosyltransferase involved in cell wall biosynthesis|nr:glycosyltransferase family 2 protein [Bacteroidota bacterium]
MLPLVSIVTPTYNRRRFIPILIKIVQQQTYPRDRLEWVVYDDGQEPVGDLLEAAKDSLPSLNYIFSDEKMTIGEKRNRLNKEAKGDILIAMDDDDFYFPERVSAAVTALQKSPSVNLAGSSKIFMFFTDTKEIYSFGPYFNNHATNGTMAWTKRYANTHTYDELVAFAEEKSFLDEYKNPLIQLDPMKVMLVISHSDNTFDKKDLRNTNTPVIKKTSLTLKDFIKDKEIRDFFAEV